MLGDLETHVAGPEDVPSSGSDYHITNRLIPTKTSRYRQIMTVLIPKN